MSKTATVITAPHLSAPTVVQKLAAEAAGTFLLVFGLIGTALYSAGFNGGEGNLNVGFLGVAFAIGLTVLIGAYAFGPLSGGHFNPAVTIGLAAAGRFSWREVVGYIVAQIVGAVIASTLLFAILASSGKPTAATFNGASNGFGELSPGGFSLVAAIIAEVVLTGLFVWVILGVTSKRAPAGFAPIAIGLMLTLIHLVAIPIDNTSVNPVRSLATAIYSEPQFLGQLWAFILFPVIGAVLAGWSFKPLFGKN